MIGVFALLGALALAVLVYLALEPAASALAGIG